MASIARSFIPMIRVQVGCNLKEEKSEQDGEAQSRHIAHILRG
jgi:hypothetical protein